MYGMIHSFAYICIGSLVRRSEVCADLLCGTNCIGRSMMCSCVGGRVGEYVRACVCVPVVACMLEINCSNPLME